MLGDCSVCGEDVPVRLNHIRKSNGTRFYRCLTKYTTVKNSIERPWVNYKKDHCEWHDGCDFRIQHPCQLGVDHIDGNRKNNDPSNLWTLCHNHHALKTYLNEDYNRRKPLV